MPYIGNNIRSADDYRLIDDISSGFNGSAKTFALQVAGSAPVPFPKTPQQCLISVNGVIQEPDPTGNSGFTLTGTNIVFSSAPTGGHSFFGIIYATADYLNAGGTFPDGAVGAPSITFTNDDDTGLYKKGSGSIGFVSNSTEITNTDSNGITISSGNLILGDSSSASSDRILLGAGSDLQLFHNGSHSNITNTTGSLRYLSNTHFFSNPAVSEVQAQFVENGKCELRFDNAIKLETTSAGATVTGSVTATGFATNGGGVTLNGANHNAAWVRSADTMRFNDNAIAGFGNADDLKIFHDGSQNIINGATGQNLEIQTNAFRVRNQADSESMIVANADSSVELYHDNSRKFETTSEGALFSGAIGINGTNLTHAANTLKVGHEGGGLHQLRGYGPDTSTNGRIQLRSSRSNGTNSFDIVYDSGNLEFPDNQKAIFGNSDDLQIYHNGTSSRIENSTGNLTIKSDNQIGLFTSTGTELYAKFLRNGAVELYHDNSKKLETRSDGLQVDGTVRLPADNSKLLFGAGLDLEIFHDGTNSNIRNQTGQLYLRSTDVRITNVGVTEHMAKFIENGAVELFHDNSKKFETTSTGVQVSGRIDITGTGTRIDIADNGKIILGDSNDLQIYHDGSHSFIDNNTGSLRFRDAGGAEKFRISGSGTQFNDDITLSNDNDKINIGASSDLQIFHDGTHNLILCANSLLIKNLANSESMIRATVNGNVELYHDNNKKFETTSTGAKVSSSTGTLRIASTTDQSSAFLEMTSSADESQVGKIRYNHANSGIVSGYLEAFLIDGTETNLAVKVDGAIKIPDSGTKDAKLLIGNSDDLQIFHDGANSIIDDAGTGFLAIRSDTSIQLLKRTANEPMLKAIPDGAVELYFDNSKRFETTSAGVTITGSTSIANTVASTVLSLHHNHNSQRACIDLTNAFATGGNSAVMIEFRDSGGNSRGTIFTSTSATTYNTSSDYRLKENQVEISDGITRLKTLKPYRFNFKVDPDTTVDGFFAHEVQLVVPQAITGTKDEVDSDNNPVYQGIDQSKLVPLLTAALQEAIAKIEVLETKVAALEAA